MELIQSIFTRMNFFNLQTEIAPRVLATDLDGTLIPLSDCAENRVDLETLKDGLSRDGKEIVFSTGRHFESVLEAISEFRLPRPNWLICDVGASVYCAGEGGHTLYEPYLNHLTEKVGGVTREQVVEAVSELTELESQGPESQGSFKVS